ncbi:MAG: 2-dehydropantoate 2-reductase, partial [Chloroflexota bacterium]
DFLASISEFSDQFPPILCLQNGIENESNIAKVLGREKVIAGTVTTAIGKPKIGNILLQKQRGIGIAAGHPLSQTIVDELNRVGLMATLYTNAMDMKWSKMLTNLLANASSAILDINPLSIFSDKDLFHLEIRQLREALAIMKAQGIKTTNLPGVPVKALAIAIKHLPLFISKPLLTNAVGKGRGDKMPSFHIDLHSGRGKSEVNYLNGAVSRAGRKLRIPTPVNTTLNDLLTLLTNDNSQIESFRNNPEHLLDLINITLE